MASSTSETPGAGAQRRRRAARATAGLAGVTYGLIVLGALVRAHGAGLACPDWPLCFGRVVPVFDVKVAFEWGHRTLAGAIAVGFAVLCWRCLRNSALRAVSLPWLAAGAALLAAQILLGALTVWELLASWTVTSHLVTGNAFALTLALLAATLGEGARSQRSEPAEPMARTAVSVCALLLAVQMVLGGLVASRFVGLACPEWPACVDGRWIPSLTGAIGLQVWHRLNGYALVTALAATALLARRRGWPAASWLVAAAALGLLQIAVGVANVLLRIPVEITGLHSALAASLVLCVGVAVRAAWRSTSAAVNLSAAAIEPAG